MPRESPGVFRQAILPNSGEKPLISTLMRLCAINHFPNMASSFGGPEERPKKADFLVDLLTGPSFDDKYVISSYCDHTLTILLPAREIDGNRQFLPCLAGLAYLDH